MDSFKYTTTGHRGYRLCSPLGEERLQWLLRAVDLPDSPKVLDLCAGKSELLIRLLEQYGGTGLAVDMNPHFVEEAQEQAKARLPAGSLALQTQDVSTFDTTERFDLVICVGARPYGDRRENLRKLCSFVKPGGQVLIAEGYWRQAPAPEYIEFLGESAEAEVRFMDHIDMAHQEGLISLYTMASTPEEFDHYDGLFGANLERYIASHPDDPDIAAMRTRIRPWRDAYLRWGRDVMGFGWYLYQVPTPPT